MALFDIFKRGPSKRPAATPAAAAPAPQTPPALPAVVEVNVQDVLPRLTNGQAPRLLDCREGYEWRQIRIPGSLHIPMGEIPSRLDELDKDQEWIVVCAHGNRSYGVAGYLTRNGYRASSLAGGLTDWWIAGGPTEQN